jgi:hypothetical protein
MNEARNRPQERKGGFWAALFVTTALIPLGVEACRPEATVEGTELVTLEHGKEEAQSDVVVTLGDGSGLSRAYVRDAFAALGRIQRSFLSDRGRFESFLEELASLHLLARRAEAKLLTDDPFLRNRIDLARERILAAALIDAELERRSPIDEADLLHAYHEHLDSFQRSARVRFRQILVKRRDAASEVEARLRSGERFADLARRVSVHPSRERAGEMGWHEVNRLEPALAEGIAKLEPGERSSVVETPFGLHIVEVQERASPEPLAFEAVRDVVERGVRKTRRDQVSADLLEEIGAAGRIALNAELVDSLHAELVDSLGPEPVGVAPHGDHLSACFESSGE